MIAVTLYTKPGCELCREARDELGALAAEYPHRVAEVNILDDAKLFERYKHSIPVVVIGETRLVYPFSSLDLRAALHSNSRLDLPAHDP
ncbi:MAG: glutaredoxin family protein [Chloroflexi bacterium]|nr:glutaredoxin family protein [Chloroflexota bacterium]